MPDADLAALGPCPEGRELTLPAHRLLTPYRFDIPAKHLYAQHREKKVSSRFAAELYAAHLQVWNNHHEHVPVKHGVEAYLESFHQILDSIRADGFDPRKSVVPVGRTLSPINGGHRIAACLLHDEHVSCRVTGLLDNYNYLYFRNREKHVRGGLDDPWQNAIALEYCRLKRETYTVLVFPSAVGRHQEILDILLAYGHVVYEKEFAFRAHGPFNLIRCVYAGEPWLGTAADNHSGLNAKVRSCFGSQRPLRFFVFETHDPEGALRAKAAIRALFGLGNHSVHINDRHDQTLRIAEALLNANSVHFLENAQPGTLARLQGLLARLREWLKAKDKQADDLCIGGSAVLAAYGLREGKDLDFLHHFDTAEPALPPDLGSHNPYAELYGRSADELIYDPRNHFHFSGFKFVSLPVVARMKKARGEKKDAADLSLMRKML